MHESSSRPFARRERNAMRRKVSVKGKAKGFKVSGCQSFSEARQTGAKAGAPWELKTVKAWNLESRKAWSLYLRCIERWL